MKRAQFVSVVNSVLQEFYYANPYINMKLMQIYASSYYGSVLWNRSSKSFDKVFGAWNVAVRCIPMKTHRYFIEPISQYTHPKTFSNTRLLKFHNVLVSSLKLLISDFCLSWLNLT